MTDTGADGQDSVLVRRGERSERDGLRLDGETYLVLSPGREAAAILRDALVRVLSLDGWSMFATPRRELVNVIDRLSKDPEGRAEATERAKAHHAKQAERAQREAAERDARAAKPDPFPAPTGPGAEALARAQEGTR